MAITTNSAAPAFDAEQPGVGERVAGHALHDRAGQAEGGPDQQAGDRPGHAQRPHDEVVVQVRVVVRERVDHRAQRDRLRSDRQAAQHDEEEHDHRADEPERLPRVRPLGRRQTVAARARELHLPMVHRHLTQYAKCA